MYQTTKQRTHMLHFEGFRNVFGTLGLELIVGKVEGRQRPNDGETNVFQQK